MKKKIYAGLLFYLVTVISYSQTLDIKSVKGLRFTVPPTTPLPLEYQTYHVELHLDSLTPYLTGSPLSNNHFDLFKKDLLNVRLIDYRKLVSQDGDFYIAIHAGKFKIKAAENVLKPRKTNAASNGYIKQITYNLPLKLVIHDKDGGVMHEIILQNDDEATSIYNPNFRLIEGTDRWTADEVFDSEKQLEEKFKEESKLVYDEIIVNNITKLIDRDAGELMDVLYNGRKNVSYSPRFYTAKVKGRQFDYSDLDTAYTAYSRAFAKLKTNPANRDSYKEDFEKALKICLDAYTIAGPRMNFELKNGMLYNIATIYYHIGNPTEARKYVAKYKVDSWDYISTQNEFYKPEYNRQDVHFVLFENYWAR